MFYYFQNFWIFSPKRLILLFPDRGSNFFILKLALFCLHGWLHALTFLCRDQHPKTWEYRGKFLISKYIKLPTAKHLSLWVSLCSLFPSLLFFKITIHTATSLLNCFCLCNEAHDWMILKSCLCYPWNQSRHSDLEGSGCIWVRKKNWPLTTFDFLYYFSVDKKRCTIYKQGKNHVTWKMNNNI